MKFVKLSRHNFQEITLMMRESQQVLPFFIANSQARDDIDEKLSDDRYQLVGLEEGGQLVGIISCQQQQQELVLSNFLMTTKQRLKKYGLSYWLAQLEKLAKLKRASQLALTIESLDSKVLQGLASADFKRVGELGTRGVFKKNLAYKTALVLAGGGARGAYQIGAWRALQELGIDYQLVTGTSVGALNGGLILQGDIEAAETMWNEIDTGKILSFPASQLRAGFTMSAMVKEIQRLTVAAVIHQGVSTQPLQALIAEVLDEEKIRRDQKDLLICTTQLPNFKEVVVSLQATPRGEFHKWLLASSSFSPAMEAAKIGDHYYVDGGFRNNIPVDVALEQGATEVIVIDVKGPGITKKVEVPATMPLVTVSSPWSLGTVLLFDGNRSKWNQRLGYLETMKAWGHYLGHWYTFDHQITDLAVRKWHQKLVTQLFNHLKAPEKELFESPAIREELLKKVRSLYNDRATVVTVSFYVLEFVGKILAIPPTTVYSVDSMEGAIKEAIHGDWLKPNLADGGMLLSLQEWLQLYAKGLPLPTERRQVVFIYQKLVENPDDPLLVRVAGVAPHLYIVAQTLYWFKQGQPAE